MQTLVYAFLSHRNEQAPPTTPVKLTKAIDGARSWRQLVRPISECAGAKRASGQVAGFDTEMVRFPVTEMPSESVTSTTRL